MLRLLLATVNPKEFQVKTAKEFLFGYTDPFINTIALKIQDFRPEKIGMIGSRKGISTDSLTIFTGEDDLNNLAEVYAMNGESNMTIWSTPECNVVKGTGKVLKKKIHFVVFESSFACSYQKFCSTCPCSHAQYGLMSKKKS